MRLYSHVPTRIKILNEDCPQDSDWEFVIEQTPSPRSPGRSGLTLSA